MISQSSAKLLDGKELSKKIKKEITTEVENWVSTGNKIPHLAAILVGTDAASETYVTHKVRACSEAGFKSTVKKLDERTQENELIEIIDQLNQNSDIDGFIVQLPLPKHISTNRVINAIEPAKDVDGFHPMNVGKLSLGLPAYISATPYGIMEMLLRYKIETRGKHCVVLGRSNIVGRPVSILLSRNSEPGNATVTLCHSKTVDLPSISRQADILVVALGKAEFVNADMVKDNAVVIDVGITRVADKTTKKGYRLKGDVRFDEVAPKCSYITPVPGGVGPMTVISLLSNTLKACKKEIYP